MSTLAGTYTSTEIVIMRNLRLPEFDKNRNVDQMKALMAADMLCAYPDPFHIFTDASDYQIGMCIIQKASQLHIIARSIIVHK